MPRVHTIKAALLEVTLFITLLALVGHVSVNFWERYIIQTELSRLKHSLHSLRNTLNYIGNAYVHLYSEIRCLADEVKPGDPVHHKEQLPHTTRTVKCKNMNHPPKLENKLTRNQGVQVGSVTRNFSAGVQPTTNKLRNNDAGSKTKMTLIQHVLNESTSCQLKKTNKQIKRVDKATQYKDSDSQVFQIETITKYKYLPKTVSKTSKRMRGRRCNRNICKYCTSDPNDVEHYCYSKF